jgi:tRNA G18 (ribose-2'-O)-methylase SpoU
MRVVRIDRVDDPRLEDYRSLTDAELLRRRGLFVAEGRLVVGRVIQDGHSMVSLLLNEAAFRQLERALDALADDTPVYICGTDEFSAVTGFNLHRGCLAMARRPAARRSGDVADGSDYLLVLEGVTDPDNVGSAFRNAAAFGAGVLLSPTCCDPLYRKAIRTSMGGVLRTPYAWLEDWPADLAMLKAKSFTLVALTLTDSAVDLQACERRLRTALLVGSEGPGLTAAAEAMADVRVRIPIHRNVDSLNLATAAAIALYTLRA